MKIVITFGTFDLFHIGHVMLLERARHLGDRLVVGVSTDDLNYSKKGIKPIFPFAARSKIVSSLTYVNEVFPEESLALKGDYICQTHADILVMGDDWKGKFDTFRSLCEVIYLPRTEGISTTMIKDFLARMGPRSL